MKKKVMVMLVCLVALGLTLRASAFLGETDGFRGIKWGTENKPPLSLSPLPGQKDGESFYEIKGENLQMRKAEVESIKYGFYKNKFFKVVVQYKSASNFKKLNEMLEEELGSGKQPSAGYGQYVWDWPSVNISLEYKSKKDEGTITYYYKPIQKEKLIDKKVEEKIKRMKDHMD